MAPPKQEITAEQPWWKEPCILGASVARSPHAHSSPDAPLPGIDEAGRGPVLGPMVYGAAFCAVSNKAALAKAAYADSKTLTEEKREALFAQLKADAAMGYMVDSISAHALSTKMLRRCVWLPRPARRLAAKRESPDDESCRVVSRQRALQPERHQLRLRVRAHPGGAGRGRAPHGDGGGHRGRRGPIHAAVQPLLVRCASCAPDPLLRARSLKERFPGIKALAAPKADRDYPIVSAASICAKVTRDTQLRDWVFEPGLAAAAPPSRAFGCGYPGGACGMRRAVCGSALTRVRVPVRRGDQGVAGGAPAPRVRLPLARPLLVGHHQAAAGGGGRRGARAVVRAPLRSRSLARSRSDAACREADAEDEEAAGGAKRTGRLPFGGCPSHLTTSSGAGRHAFMRSRKLQRVTAF